MKLKKFFLLYSFFLICCTEAFFPQSLKLRDIKIQNYSHLNPVTNLTHSYLNEKVNWSRTIISSGAILSADIALWQYYDKAYYSDPRVKFHVKSDWYNYALNIDKLGHFHSAMVLNKLSYKVIRWSNISESSSMWMAAAFAWLHLFQMEMFDAYQERWGFSFPDLAANTAGSLYPNLQYLFPVLQGTSLKVSYHPSSNYENGNVKHFIEDYEGRTYWLSIYPYNFLPEEFKKFCPDWFGLSLGYGGDKLIKNNGNYNSCNKKGLGDQEWYIAFDYDLLKLFKPDKDTFLYQLLDIINLIHLPSPAIRFEPTTICYGLYF